jgi:DNA gyrase/topoisomerase IV subunit B
MQRMDKVMENKQVKYLFEALGMTKIGDYFESRYEKIVLMSDADPDGNHINTLILTLLYQFTPFLIKEGRVQILLTPLYGLVNKDHFEPLYVLPQKVKSGYELLRFKGLGEMTGTQMKKILETAKYYDVKWQEDFDLKELFEDISIKRKLLEISDDEINLQLYGTQ